VYWFPNSVTKGIYVYYGNAHYATQLEAVAAIETESFTEAPNTAAQALFLGYMILRHNANFTTAASYQLIQGGMFRGGGSTAGGGGATSAGGNPTEIQYNNSGVFGGVPTLTYDGTTLRATGSFSGSLVGTATSASYVLQAISASFATSASFSKTLAASLINDGTGLKLLNSDGSTISNISELTSSIAIMASTASFVRGLQQTLSVGNLTSAPSTENTLNVYPPIISSTGEGGQILLAASGGLYTSASMLDTYQNYFRILRGSNTLGSNAQLIGLDLHTGNLSIAGAVNPSAWSAGQVIKDTILSNTDVTISTTTIATSTSDTDFLTYNYTPVSSNSYLIIHYHLANYDFSGGTGNDSYISRIKVDGNEITYSTQSTVNGNRSGVLFPLMGRYTNSSTAAKSIVVACRRNSADDSITITDSATSMWLRITEIAR
jgi:hypothetical protein